MRVTKTHSEILLALFFVALIAVVFQQIYTSMAEQGIAEGSPYDNAAAYPKTVAIFIGLLLIPFIGTMVARRRRVNNASAELTFSDLRRPAALLAIFAAYLLALPTLGYHIATAPMIISILALAGLRKPLEMLLVGLGVSFAMAYAFEVFLKIVLPGGVFGFNIPW